MSQKLLSEFEQISAIATSPQGIATLKKLCEETTINLWIPQTPEDSIKEHLKELWGTQKAIIFSLATGAVVRLIAPLLTHKSTDPGIIVVDGAGKFVISLCGGHQRSADKLTQILAQILDATPILTGASATANLPAIDTLGFPYGWRKGTGDWTAVNAAVTRGEKIQVFQEVGSTLWQENLPPNHPFDFTGETVSPAGRIWISATQRRFAPNTEVAKVQWHPRVLWVGIGCERGTSKELISQGINQVFEKAHLSPQAIAGIATIDLKADETGLIVLTQERNLPLVTFTAQQLSQVVVPNPSSVVESAVGTPSVAEAAALLAASHNQLLVTKQVLEKMTVAIALGTQEYIGRTGRLYLVGTGPGALSQMTSAAKAAITAADAVIGYQLYIDLIKPLLRVEQIVESLPITQEKARAIRGISLAEWGLTVAVISSGDCGIYGMAGLVLEELGEKKDIEVEVFPGVSALQAASSRVGAPLMHDFCTISLSDLLTPWEVIKERIVGAAKADFVTIIYNPRSQTRTQQIVTTQSIFLQYRQPTTPVAIVRAAYRLEEEVTLTTLAEMLTYPIDMLTTVIIGNSSSFIQNNRLITPRGYN